MKDNWTYGQKLVGGYAVMVAFLIALSVVSIYALRTTVASKDSVITVAAQALLETRRMEALEERLVASVRLYLLLRDDDLLVRVRTADAELNAAIERLKRRFDLPEPAALMKTIEQTANEYRQVSEPVLASVGVQDGLDATVRTFEERVLPVRRQLNEALASIATLQERRLQEDKQASTDAASTAITLLVTVCVLAIVFAILVAAILSRSLSRQIGTAVGHVQSSSSELQAAANQQASGAKEQASAMSEITTTISELAATSRQIAESAQQVAQIAEQTAAAGRSGEETVSEGQEAMAGIRRQVDQVVNHMLDLGRKSQEIGGVLDIVSELAEQTNILAINATIEASGAGEAGRRFAVVADEIRKLADRVAGATKEIRTLIEDVRGAVNTTVMATESGAKAVDGGARQFGEVATAFQRIAELVATTTEAAREIELSTKQQVSAAEQVRVSVTEVAQASKETEASTSQTLQTASQLSGLSLELQRLIRPQAA